MKITFNKNKDLDIETVAIYTNPALESKWSEMKENLFRTQKTVVVINAQNNKKIQVYIKDIVAIQSEDRCCNVIMKNGAMYLMNMRLKYVENNLNLENIIRINNTTMINLEHVLEFSTQNNSRIEVFLGNHSSYFVSRYYIKNFRRILL